MATIDEAVEGNMALSLNLGSGDHRIDGFTNVDLYDETADVRADICELPFENESVDEIVAYQVIEHVAYNKAEQMFDEMYRVLKKGGTMITECPDIEWDAKQIAETGDINYQNTIHLWGEYYRPWDTKRYKDWEHAAPALHINGFTWKKIQQIAEHYGFEVKRLGIEDMVSKFEENLAVLWTK